MAALVFKRRKSIMKQAVGDIAVKVDAVAYNMIIDVADETGYSIKKVVSDMVRHAYGDVQYED